MGPICADALADNIVKLNLRDLVWFDRIRGGLAPHNMAPSILRIFRTIIYAKAYDFCVLGVWSMWK
jgi:hypothetical protein